MIVFLLLMFLHYKTEMVCCIISVLTLVFFNKSFFNAQNIENIVDLLQNIFCNILMLFQLQKPNQLKLQKRSTVLQHCMTSF